MADLVVDLSLLDSIDRTLGMLANEFNDASAIMSGYAATAVPGNTTGHFEPL